MDYIKILGSFGTKTFGEGTTCIQVSKKVLIDAGNIINSLKEDAKNIEYLFLTHSHIDHILDLPFLIDLYYTDQTHTLNIYALEETINSLKNHLFNYELYPDFSQINLLNSTNKALKFNVIDFDQEYCVDGITLKPVQTNHTVSSCGYVITKNTQSILFTSDTYINDTVWELLNRDHSIRILITEVSFPSEMYELARQSKHYTPLILSQELKKLNRDDITIHLMHFKPNYMDVLLEEIDHYGLLKNGGMILHEGFLVTFERRQLKQKRELTEFEISDQLIQTGIALSAHENLDLLEQKILESAMKLTGADAGTLYQLNSNNSQLQFKALMNESLGIRMSGGEAIDWEPLYLYDSKGEMNLSSVAASCALESKVINIEDVYRTEDYNFSGTKKYDVSSGYRSQSMLVAPMLNHEKEVIGVLQLINKKDILGEVIRFDAQDVKIIQSLASQAAVSINNEQLISDLEKLLEDFLKTINIALDEKSPYTAGHISRMVDLSVSIAEKIHADAGAFSQKLYSDEEIKEIRIAALMHDIGKIVTPEYIMDKRTKLDTIFDRIVLIQIKSELLKRDAKIRLLEQQISAGTSQEVFQEEYEKRVRKINDDFTFLSEANEGKEFFPNEQIQRVKAVAEQNIEINGLEMKFLNKDEVKNLSVQKGTLTDEQREEINNHADVSLRMLQSLPFPKILSRVPEIAAGHHEKISGGGYPLGLKGDEISFEARILAIADIFEALTASDRPYKKAKKLSESMQILWYMAKDGDIDRDICQFFYESGLYLEYASQYLNPGLIDEVVLDFSFESSSG